MTPVRHKARHGNSGLTLSQKEGEKTKKGRGKEKEIFLSKMAFAVDIVCYHELVS